MVEKKQKEFSDMTVKELTKLIAGPSQISRKNAAKQLVVLVKENPANFKKNIPDFIDALSRPEAQTRWLALDALTMLVPIDTKACKAAIEGAEEALFDEKTTLIQESAIRFLSRYGATSKQRSKEVWPLIKDALQQYHGEIDFDKLLNRVIYFASGNLDANVKKEFRAVVKDIINSVGGPTKVRLNRIILTLNGKKLVVQAKNRSDKNLTDSEKKVGGKKMSTKKPAAKKTAAKKTAAKKTAAKKPVKKTVAKKAVKKAAPKKKTAAKKTTAKKTAAKKTTAKKTAVKKTAPKKTAAKKTTAKKAVKKAAPKKKTVKKSPAKKTAKKTVKKAAPKKKTAKKPAAKKTVKKAVKKAAPKKKTAKKTVKKAAPKKKTAKKR